MKKFGILIASVSLLAACNSGGDSADSNEIANDGNAVSDGPAASGNIAGAGTPAPQASCPPAASSAKGPDVLGVRLGMSAEEAFSALACANPAFDIEYRTENVSQLPPMPDGSLPRTAVVASAGDDVATAYLMGPTGREKAIVLMHDIAFAPEQAPSVQDMVASLREKYGAAEDVGGTGSAIVRSLAHAPGGAAFRADGSDFKRCSRVLGWNSEGQFITEGGCGLTINYRIDRRADNPNLAQKLYVIVADQEASINATLQARRDIETMRRGGGADRPVPAQPGAPVPKL